MASRVKTCPLGGAMGWAWDAGERGTEKPRYQARFGSPISYRLKYEITGHDLRCSSIIRMVGGSPEAHYGTGGRNVGCARGMGVG